MTVNESVFYLYHRLQPPSTERGQQLARAVDVHMGPAEGRHHFSRHQAFFFSLLLTLECVLEERQGL